MSSRLKLKASNLPWVDSELNLYSIFEIVLNIAMIQIGRIHLIFMIIDY
jgi:hypothetical protein